MEGFIKRTPKSRKSLGHAIVELPLAMMILLLLILLPMVNLLAMGFGAASVALLVHQSVSRAASQEKYDEALISLCQESTSFLQTGFAKLCRIQPRQGYQSCGIDLFVQETDFHTKAVKTYGPNIAMTGQADTLDNIYEYTANGCFQISPLLSLAGIPFIGEIPGLGQPAVLKFSASRALEHPHSLDNVASVVGYSPPATTPVLNDTVSTPGQIDPNGSWNYPNIYELIKAAGERVVSEDVLIVQANSESWTISNAQCAPGQRVWVDTHARGQWTVTGWNPFDANGTSTMGANFGFPSGALVSQVGDNGPLWMAGKDRFDYVPQTSGQVEFRCNDGPGWFKDNTGEQVVRVIVTAPN